MDSYRARADAHKPKTLEAQRAAALDLVARGLSPYTVAQVLGVAVSQVRAMTVNQAEATVRGG